MTVCFNTDEVDVRYTKLLTATTEQVYNILEGEKRALKLQMEEEGQNVRIVL